ncbi:MAG TPA: transglutaminase family protein [Burkholderiaceae bacterium]|nr:transglutaminase family protein [Burkholderiaceae bacterium]
MGELIVEHDTEYQYSSHVGFAQHLAHLTPRSLPGQSVEGFQLDIDPPPSRLHTSSDYFDNLRTYFALTVAHESLRVRTRSRVHLQPRFDQLDLSASPPWESVRASTQYVASAPFCAASEFCFDSPLVPRSASLHAYAVTSFPSGQPLLEGVKDLMRRIHQDFRYDALSTDVSTPVLDAFAARAGVCQDFSHVMIGCLRSLGLAARYVSGYLFTQARAALTLSSEPEPTVIGAGASHAWVSAFCPHFGWIEFDPTNNAIPGTGHVRLASGRDYGDVAPLRGVVQGGGEHQLRVAVRVSASPQ